jgi:hypothetical protein
MIDAAEDVKLVAEFLGGAMGGKLSGSLKTITAFKRLKSEGTEYRVLGLIEWLLNDPKALDILLTALERYYDKCSPEVKAQGAELFSALVERLMNSA